MDDMKSSGRNLDEITDPIYHPYRRLQLKVNLVAMVVAYAVAAVLAIIRYFDPNGDKYVKTRKYEDDYLRKMRRNR